MGKEMMVFVERLKNQLLLMNKIPYTAKFGGAANALRTINKNGIASVLSKAIANGNILV
jgi:hypothetical protein